MPRFQRKGRQLSRKQVILHSNTFVKNTGPAAGPEFLRVIDCAAGARTTTGAAKSITQNRGTDELCNIGDQIAYVNIFIQCAVRPVESTDDDERVGWLEYGYVIEKEDATSVPLTSIGTTYLGVILKRMFPSGTIWTGNMPVGKLQPNSVALHLKIPKNKVMLKDGDVHRFFFYFRDVKSTAVETDSVRCIISSMYKGYN